VHRNVDSAGEQGLLELLDEDAAGTELAEGARSVTVACGRDRDERDLDPRPAQRSRGALGLDQRQPTSAGADAKQHSGGS